MERSVAIGALLGGMALIPLACYAESQPPTHVMLSPDELKWTDSAALPGAKIAVIEGPLNKAVPFTIRLKHPAGYKIPPHWHPAIEHLTVISGTLNLGFGDKLDTSETTALTAGSVAIMQPKTVHFTWTEEETITQVHGVGSHLREPGRRPEDKEVIGSDALRRSLGREWFRATRGRRTTALEFARSADRSRGRSGAAPSSR
jgi:quercetin dioxygenase-like cupin family protein